MADELLQWAVADRHASGDRDMRADRARELEEAQEPGPAAIDLSDAPDEIDDLRDDEDDVEDGARADRRDHRDAFGRRRDLALDFGVERAQQRALGNVDEIASVDDRAGGFNRLRPRGRR